MKYAFIQQQGQHHPIRRLCQVLGVSTSGYYDWLLRPESNRAKGNRRLLTKIQCFHKASRDIYGSPRIHQDLLSCGEQVGIHRVARLMKKADIQSRMARKFVITTNSKNTLAPAPDRLERRFYSHRKNQTWVSDTTFIATRQGWLYLAIVLDLFSRQVIGWAMGDKNSRQLVINALTMAIWRRGEARDVIVHSDQGSTYASLRHLRCRVFSRRHCADDRRKRRVQHTCRRRVSSLGQPFQVNENTSCSGASTEQGRPPAPWLWPVRQGTEGG